MVRSSTDALIEVGGQNLTELWSSPHSIRGRNQGCVLYIYICTYHRWMYDIYHSIRMSHFIYEGHPIHVVYGMHFQALCCYPASGQGESGKILVTPNDNPTYKRHYFVDILVLNHWLNPRIWVWGYMVGAQAPNFYHNWESLQKEQWRMSWNHCNLPSGKWRFAVGSC